jgi:tetratricopeptide repeat protein
MKTLMIGLAAAVLPLAAGADEVYLKSGGQLSGRIVSRTATSIEVDIGAGKITVPTSHVVRIEEGRSALQEYEERAARVAAGDAEAWLALGDWADARGLGSQAREAYNRALSAQPDNARANTALGNVRLNNQWVSQEEGYRAQGFVPFEGEWITPNEHAAILRERALEADQERARVQAELSARETEARTAEAEARARQAEAEAQSRAEAEASGGIPLWYAWGAGPASWNTNSIAMRPVQPVNSIGIRR